MSESAPWPAFLTPPRELHGWLLQEALRRQKEGEPVSRHLATLRWLVLAELDRSVPEPSAKPEFSSPTP
jgi:hypothetical protein